MKYTLKRKIYIVISAAALLAVLVTIFYLSAQTAKESSGTSGGLISWLKDALNIEFSQDFIRTVAHMCEFAGLGLLVQNMEFSLKSKTKPLLCVLLSWAYAWTDEIHQIFVDGRAFQLSDLFVDLAGIILGVAAFNIFYILIKKKKSVSP